MSRLKRRVGGPLRRAFEVELQRALTPMIKSIRASLPSITTESDAKKLGRALSKTWSDERLLKLIMSIGAKAEKTASKAWPPELRQDAIKKSSKKKPYDRDALLEKWSQSALERITSVRNEVAIGLQADIVAAAKAGLDPATLAAKWTRSGIPVKFGTLEGRTKVIAQNQLAILHSEVQRARAEAVGVTEFIWRTQGDSRVRPAHQALEGRTFDYKSPPSEGLPGHPVNCRCYSESVISDELYSSLVGGFGVEGAIEK